MPNMSERGTNLEQGEDLVFFAAAARGVSASTTSTAIQLNGERKRYIFVLDTTVCDVDAADTLDVYIDFLVGTFWINAVHFTQRIGTDGAVREFAILDTTTPGALVIVATADAASGVTRPTVIGSQVRGRYTIVEGAGGGVTAFTFSLIGYAI